jgi:preprotein translocase subunit SecD
LTAPRRLTLLALLLAAAALAAAGSCEDCLGGKSVEFTVGVDAGREQVKQLRRRVRPLREKLAAAGVTIERIKSDAAGRRLLVSFRDEPGRQAGVELIAREFPELAAAEGEGLTSAWTLTPAESARIQEQTLQSVAAVLARRAASAGAKGVTTELADPRIKLRIQRVKAADLPRLRGLLVEPGRLDFILVAAEGRDRAVDPEGNFGEQAILSWRDPLSPGRKLECYFGLDFGGGHSPSADDQRLVLAADGPGSKPDAGRKCYLLDESRALGGGAIQEAAVGTGGQGTTGPVISITLDAAGGEAMGKLTAANLGKLLAIVYQDRVISAPVIQSRVADRVQIAGNFEPAEAERLAAILRAGALPEVELNLETEGPLTPAR